MKILYGARMARYDLLRAVCHSASCVTKWNRQNDVDLYRLICYINTTLDFMQVSWLGDTKDELRMQIFADADFAGDPRTQRSTSGVVLAVVAPYTRCLLSAASRRQTCVSHSTPEAEIVAADLALRTEAIPAIPLWERLLGRKIDVDFMEDNEAVVKICRSGNSQKLMHLPRTHRVDAAFIAECTKDLAVCTMGHTHTDNQAADICTKSFTDPPKWLKLL